MDRITITIEEIRSNPNLDLSERVSRLSKNSHFSKEDLEDIAVATIKREYEYWANNRTNLSDNTTSYLARILDGHILNEYEEFEMMCDDPVKIELYRKHCELKRRIQENKAITLEDFNSLCETIGFDLETTEEIRKGFEQKGLIIYPGIKNGVNK